MRISDWSSDVCASDLVVGAGLLARTVAALVGILQRRPYGEPLAAWTGLVVAVGFIAYHAVPWTSAVTNPYLGEPVGAPAWLSVGAAVAAGAWCAWSGRATLRRGRWSSSEERPVGNGCGSTCLSRWKKN